MARQIVPINQEHHADLKVKDGGDFSQVANENIVPLVVYEFMLCASECPIIFIKHGETGRFQPVALMGFKPGENYFVDGDKWRGMFIPGLVASYPFRLVPNPHNEEQLFMAVDMDSQLVGNDDGNALFNADGSESEFFAKRKQEVTKYFEFNQITDGFCQLMADLDLFTARDMNLDLNGEKITIQSVYMLDDEKFNKLSDERFLDLRKRGFLPAIYAHRNSLNQVRRLAEMKLGH